MPDNPRFPYKLETAIFTTVNCRRPPAIPNEDSTFFRISLKIVDANFPKLEVFLKLSTPEESSFQIELELVGIFVPIENQPAPTRSIIGDFINEQALFMMWPNLTQMIVQVTANMGMNPIRIPTPHHFNLKIEPSPETQSE